MDNYARWRRYDDEKESWLERRPECCCCGDHIQDEYAFYINDEWICPDCMKEHFRKEVMPEW